MGRNNADFSHGSSYWKDKDYGHVAPDGTVHPQRAADRVTDARREADQSGAKLIWHSPTFYTRVPPKDK